MNNSGVSGTISPATIATNLSGKVIPVLSARYENGQYRLTVYAGNQIETLVVTAELAAKIAGT